MSLGVPESWGPWARLASMNVVAGWYLDPSGGPGALRWWDGERWTDHVSLTALPPPPPSARDVLSTELDVGRLARAGAIATVVVAPIQLVVSALLLPHVADLLRDAVLRPSATGGLSAAENLLWVASSVVSLVPSVVFVLTLAWVYASARTGARLGIPARHSPGWAVGGFLVPVLDLWWPYQSVRDLFPAGHPARRMVGRWWAQYLTALVATTVSLGVLFVSEPAALVLLTGAAVLQVGAALTLRRIIGLAADTHTDLVDALAT